MPADDNQPAEPPPHFEDPNVPMVYADGCWGAGWMNGDNILLTFAAKIVDHTKSPPGAITKTTVRVVLPARAAENMSHFIQEFLGAKDAGNAPPAINKTLN